VTIEQAKVPFAKPAKLAHFSEHRPRQNPATQEKLLLATPNCTHLRFAKTFTLTAEQSANRMTAALSRGRRVRQGVSKMRRISFQCPVAALVILFAVSVPVPAAATGPIDATLYTTYNLNGTTVDFSVCGSTQESSGCYGGGTLGPFVRLGALIEGNPSTNLETNTVTRFIYALDIAAGTNSDGVALYVYKKTDAITSTFDTVTVTLFKTVALPLTGGSTASASMAANAKFLFIGTNQSTQAVRLQKSNFAILESGNFSPPIPVTAITSNAYGYVTVTFGDFSGLDVDNGFIVYAPDGNTQQDGGGAPFMLGTQQAVLPTALP
jgi:hypothetical protein